MTELDWQTLVAIVVSAALSAALGLAILGRRSSGAQARGLFTSADHEAAVFLFDGEALADATPGARALLAHGPLRSGPPWLRLMSWLGQGMPEAAPALARLAEVGRVQIDGTDPQGRPLSLSAEWIGGLARIALRRGDTGPPAPVASPTLLPAALERNELEAMRAVMDEAPIPIWREAADGAVQWGNAAFLGHMLERLPPDRELSWPLPRLFAASTGRQALLGPDGTPAHWFDVQSAPAPAGGAEGEGSGARLCYAVPADAAVQAETTLRGFMQTLTKTFAELRTGLAIFDQDRRLQIFNPALIDLTRLSPGLLSRRPTLLSFLDALRDAAMIPEPPDYRRWRRHFASIEKAAEAGHYDEVWHLPSGQTYRVTGRPHPNGALALMFEDITEELGQSRRYRADLELGQEVIDALDEAIAVFGPDGAVVMSNNAYARLWGHDPMGVLDPDAGRAGALIGRWRQMTAPSPLWDRLEDALCVTGPLASWQDSAFLPDGRRLHCGMVRMERGSTLVRFRAEVTRAAATPDDAASDANAAAGAAPAMRA